MVKSNCKILLIVLLFNSCQKIKYYPDKEYSEVTTLIIAHRGNGGNPIYQGNSIEAAEYGLMHADGIEVDIQLSKDRTIWLAHDAELPDCGGVFYDCFPEAYDYEIIELDSCNGDEMNYYKLEDIFDLMSTKYPGKIISLDVKIWSPCAVTSVNIFGVMNVIADEIIRLTDKYNMHNLVMAESEVASFLIYLQENSSGIETYLSAWGDFERAMQISLEGGFSGISFKYKFDEEINTDHIQLIRKKGLKIQLWTVNSEEDINEALSINPDYIQTDNIDYFLNHVFN